MFKFLMNHKTKIMGFLITVLGAVQASAGQLTTLLSPKHYAVVMVIAGICVAALGFLNSAMANKAA